MAVLSKIATLRDILHIKAAILLILTYLIQIDLFNSIRMP